MIEATCICPFLYQGSYPPPGFALAKEGFKTLVLCAEEYQPPYVIPDFFAQVPDFYLERPFPGVKVIYAPNDDSSTDLPSREVLAKALSAAHEVAFSIKMGKKALVTCWQGRNRSGLVSALTLHFLLGCSGMEAVRIVQRARRGALTNPAFVHVLSHLRPVQKNVDRSPASWQDAPRAHPHP